MIEPYLPKLSPYEDEFRLFAAEDARGLPADPVLFFGSSSIRLWDSLARDFAGLSVVNRGFGGSTLAECLAEMERLVFPVNPRAIVLYAGDNDLNQGASPQRVLALFEQFMARLRERLGAGVPVVFVSIKPSPARLWNIERIGQTNAIVRAACAVPGSQARFLDVFPAMLEGGWPRRELFTGDGLHMSRAGYEFWMQAVRGALRELGLLP